MTMNQIKCFILVFRGDDHESIKMLYFGLMTKIVEIHLISNSRAYTSSSNGKLLWRLPVRLKMAFPMAGAMTLSGGSPIP